MNWTIDRSVHKPYDAEEADWHVSISRPRTSPDARLGDHMLIQFSSNGNIRTKEQAADVVDRILSGLNEQVN